MKLSDEWYTLGETGEFALWEKARKYVAQWPLDGDFIISSAVAARRESLVQQHDPFYHVPYFPYDFISMLPQRHLRVCVGPEASYAQC